MSLKTPFPLFSRIYPFCGTPISPGFNLIPTNKSRSPSLSKSLGKTTDVLSGFPAGSSCDDLEKPPKPSLIYSLSINAYEF